MNFLKKLPAFAAVALIGTLLMATLAMANPAVADDYTLIFNGVEVSFTDENPPVIVDGSTLLPLRFLFDLMNVDETGDLEWDPGYRQVTIIFDETEARLWIGNTHTVINGVDTPIGGAAPILFNDRTYVPLPFLAQTFDMTVGWDSASRTASLIDNTKLDRIMELVEASAPKELEDLRMSMDLSGDMSVTVSFMGENEEVDMTLESTMRIDLTETFSHATVTIVAEGETVVTEQFDDGEWLYTVVEDVVIKMPSMLAQMDDLNVLMAQFEALGFGRKFYTAFRLEEAGDNYILSGPMFVGEDMFMEIFAAIGMEDMLGDLGAMSISIRGLRYNVVINRETGLMISMDFQFEADFSMTIEGEEMLMSMNADLRITNLDFDAEFDTVVPAEIVENAVELDALDTLNELDEDDE